MCVYVYVCVSLPCVLLATCLASRFLSASQSQLACFGIYDSGHVCVAVRKISANRALCVCMCLCACTQDYDVFDRRIEAQFKFHARGFITEDRHWGLNLRVDELYFRDVPMMIACRQIPGVATRSTVVPIPGL